MVGSKTFSVSKQELGQVLWVSLLFGLAAAVAKFVELGSALDWGSFTQMWGIAAAALLWLVKRYLSDSREPMLFRDSIRGTPKN